jgi:hypothetical protein
MHHHECHGSADHDNAAGCRAKELSAVGRRGLLLFFRTAQELFRIWSVRHGV